MNEIRNNLGIRCILAGKKRIVRSSRSKQRQVQYAQNIGVALGRLESLITSVGKSSKSLRNPATSRPCPLVPPKERLVLPRSLALCMPMGIKIQYHLQVGRQITLDSRFADWTWARRQPGFFFLRTSPLLKIPPEAR